ncbi:MAG: S-layer homology domain-containing protein [Clostridia bacterium]|nr:S-layer homology domain-containing protein [Clostridia bacterium]
MKKRLTVLTSTLLAALFAMSGMTFFSGAETAKAEASNSPEIIHIEPGPVKDVFLTSGKDETCCHVTWQSEGEGAQYLQWSEADGPESDPEEAGLNVNVMAEKDGNTFRAEMTGLKSGHSYTYRVGGPDVGWSPFYTFKSGDFGDGKLSFLVAGDPQLGGGLAEFDTQRWDTTLRKAEQWFGDSIEFLVTAGDQVNSNDIPREVELFAYPEFIQSHPLLTVPGNHDNFPEYSACYTYSDVDQATVGEAGPYGGDYWVARDGVLFLCINSIDVSKPLHREFIERATEECTALYGAPNWKIVVMHYSCYPGAKNRWNSDYRKEYSPIFSDLGVDAVLCGHDHVYARSYISNYLTVIDDPERYEEVFGQRYGSYSDPAPEDVFYMTANTASGSKYYEIAETDLPYLEKKVQENVPTITKVDVTADMLVLTTYRTGADNEIGDVMDFFAIHRREGVTEDVYAPVLTVPTEDYYDASKGIDLMAGVSAYDNFDGDVTADIKITGKVDPTRISVVSYTVTDAAGNRATAERRLIPVPEDTLVSEEKTEWNYLDDGTMPFDFYDEDTVSWTLPGFDDSEWKTARGAFGALNGEPAERNGRPVNTLLNMVYPEDADEPGVNIPNFFFRASFDLSEPEKVTRLRGIVWVDDAAEVYINGVKVLRINLVEGDLPWNYGSLYDPHGGALPVAIDITDPDLIASMDLKKKGNVIAVELYQVKGSSEDIYLGVPYFIATYERTDGLPFTDVPERSWFYLNTAKAYVRGLFSGVSETLFAPHTGMTRAMVWRVLTRAVGAEVPKGDKWYSGSQTWAVENGVSDGTMPNAGITREQLVTMLYALSGKPETNASLLDAYNDKATASKWARNALCWAIEKELMTGRGGGILAPKDPVTRAEACTIIIKYIDNVMAVRS